MNKFNLQFGVGELCLPKLLSLNLLFILAMFLFGLSSCKKEQVNKTPLINVNKIAPTQASAVYPTGSPVQINGKLKVTGKYLSNNCGYPIQLRGMSSHGAQWFSNCYNASALDALKNSWGIDVFRIAMYINEGGYSNNPAYWKTWIDNMVTECGNRGIYVIIDWHVLTPGDPWANIDASREFWTYMATKHKGKDHVIYEICNEPNGDAVTWPVIKSYAQDIIPRIRAIDPNTIIIVGTPSWSQGVKAVVGNALSYSNIMYALHIYTGTHTQWLRDEATYAFDNGIPMFMTEFGTSQASGDGGPYLAEGDRWMDWAAERKISWTNWSFADKNEVSAALAPGACGVNWNNTSISGAWVKQRILSPADNFVVCAQKGPFTGTPYAVPGIIEAENFDLGGENLAYHDSESANLGGQYRISEGVDIETCSEGGFNVGYVNTGEWLDYSVNVATSGTYKIDVRVASSNATGAFKIDFNGINKTNSVAVPSTSGWQAYTTVSKEVNLTSGTQVMSIYALSGGFNINKVTITNTNPNYNAHIEAESFNQMSGVQVESCSEGGQNVGYIDAGDWMTYPVNIPTSGTYKVSYRVASSSGGGKIRLDKDAGTTILGTKDVGSTGGWQNWQTVSHDITLPAGQYNLGMNATIGGFNINWLEITKL